jgi:hypothetical protein
MARREHRDEIRRRLLIRVEGSAGALLIRLLRLVLECLGLR